MERKAQAQEEGISHACVTVSFPYSRFSNQAPNCLYLLPPAGLRGGVHAKAPGAGGLL